MKQIILTAEERDAMRNLSDYAERCFKSKRALRILSNLHERGLIEFDPFTASAIATPDGAAIAHTLND